VFGSGSNIEIPSYNEDLSSWTCLDGQSWNSNSVDQTEDFNQNVDSSDDYDNVLSVADLSKRRRSIWISDKTAKKHKNDMGDRSSFWVAGETVGIYVGDPISGNLTTASIGVDVQSSAACGSYDEVVDGDGENQEWDDVLVEEEQGHLFPDNEEVIHEEEVVVMPDEDAYNDSNYLLDGIETYHQEKYKRDQISMDMETGIVLLCELQKFNVSLEVYNKITKWVEPFYSYTGLVGKPLGHNAMFKYLTCQYQLECLLPWKTK